MKRAIVSVVLLATVAVFWVGKPAPSRLVTSTGGRVPVEVRLPTARQPLPSRAVKPGTSIKACEGYTRTVLSLDLEQLGYEGIRKSPSRGSLLEFAKLFREKSLGRGCGKLPDQHPLHYTSYMFSQTCGSIPELSGSNERQVLGQVEDCVHKLYIFRLQALADAYSQVPASAIQDPKLISVLLLGTPGLSPETWVNRYAELAQRRWELSPTDPAAAADRARGAFAKLLTAPGEANAQAVATATDELEKLEPGSPRVLENRMLLARTQADFESMKTLALEKLEKGENVDEARFYLAQSHFLTGDKIAAAKEIQALIQKDPRQRRWLRALEGIQKSPPGTAPEMIFADRNTAFGFDEQDPFL